MAARDLSIGALGVMDKEHLRDAKTNRKKYIYGLKNLPLDIRKFHKKNQKLTKTERFMSAFLQSCIRYGYVSAYRAQQIIKLGTASHYIISDFFLYEPKIIIEVDGPEHLKKKDQWRDKEVRRLFGYGTIRVTNKDVTTKNKETRTRLIRELAKAEGLSARRTRQRVKEYWYYQEAEGYG